MKELLQIDPAKRLTAEEVLEHELFEGVAKNLNFNEILDISKLVENGTIVKIYRYDEETDRLKVSSRRAGTIYRQVNGVVESDYDPR